MAVFKGYGARTVLLGGAGDLALVVNIEARKNKSEIVTQIILSYARPAAGLAALNSLGCQGRITIFKSSQDDTNFPDPVVDTVGDASVLLVDCIIREQGEHVFIDPTDPIEIPASETYAIVLAAAYIQGDAAGAPSQTIGSLTVRGRTKGGGTRIDEE